MNKTKNYFKFTAALMLIALLSTVSAEELYITDFDIQTIASPESLHQAIVILDFDLPEAFDSTTDISFAQLSVNMEFTLSNIFPMTLGCAPILPGIDIESLSFEEVLDSLPDFVYQSFISTYSTADTEAVTSYFDITSAVKAAISDEIQFSGLMVFPLESNTYIYGLSDDPPFIELKVNYSIRDQE